MGLETRENVRSVFERYPEGLHYSGYPLARSIADEIADWVDVAPVFVKYTPNTVDVGLIKVHLNARYTFDAVDVGQLFASGATQKPDASIRH